MALFFFLWVFRESKIFPRGYFVGPIFLLVANFLIQGFPVADCIRKSERKHKCINTF